MKNILMSLIVALCFSGMAGAQTVETAAPPPLIPFSGTMTDLSGEPLVGTVTAIFALYEDATGGVPLWVDIQMVQTDAAGGYLSLLGAATELPVDLFASSQALWLGIQPEGQAEQPRVRFFSVPYALKAGDADTLGGRSVSEFMLLSGGEGEGGGNFAAADAPRTRFSDGWLGNASRADITYDTLTVTGETNLLGDVGIGTSSPARLFDVSADRPVDVPLALISNSANATDYAQGLHILTPNTGTNHFSALAFGKEFSQRNASTIGYYHAGDDSPNSYMYLAGHSVNDLLVLKMNGNVGIGTSAPDVRMHVTGSAPIDVPVHKIINTVSSVNYSQGLHILTPNTGTNHFTGVAVGKSFSARNAGTLGYYHVADGSTSNYLYLGGHSNDDALVVRMDGNVGIGTTSPSTKLHVAGDITVDGNIAAKYQDVAEWVEAVDAPTPGTVVIADSTGRNRVKISEDPYDTKVLGVVSLQPGLILGEPGPTKVLVAQSGRVKVKVDASYGAITAGDLLSTSATPGYAMRSESTPLGGASWHRPGTVLGKALESLQTGRGEILVLITLQ